MNNIDIADREARRKTYLAMIKNSIGSRMFRSLYARVDDNVIDITWNGERSCAYFTTALLYSQGLVSSMHATIDGAVADILKRAGTRRNTHKREWLDLGSFDDVDAHFIPFGAVLIWESQKRKTGWYRHMGFYTDRRGWAISLRPKTRRVELHHYLFNGRRKLERVFVPTILLR